MEDKIKPVGSPPRGWHMKKKYIDVERNVFEKGKFSYNQIETAVEELADEIAHKELLKEAHSLEKSIAELRIIKEHKQKTWDYSRGWDEYVKLTKEEDDEIGKLDRQLRLIRPYDIEDIPDYGTVMFLNEFKNNVKNGGFIDYDGYGHYIETTYGDDGEEVLKMTDIVIHALPQAL